eukprot:GHVL01011992.1.p2 GENE.GHVL01011992.1~~GHVL01011992.1.p2  ORF type:complete len:599 (+),score=102.11 GHVL01011992.1:4490-6286(+)
MSVSSKTESKAALTLPVSGNGTNVYNYVSVSTKTVSQATTTADESESVNSVLDMVNVEEEMVEPPEDCEVVRGIDMETLEQWRHQASTPPGSRESSVQPQRKPNESEQSVRARKESLYSRMSIVNSAKLNIGRTALCLSGGGALAMYHIGLLRVLIEEGLMPRVISGASGGAIIGAILASNDDETLLRDYLVPGMISMYPKRIFPTMMSQILHYVVNGHMLDENEFVEACKCYFKDYTFYEAYQKTGRIMNIVVSPASRAGEPLILNYINAPEVLLWSAVAASCSLPGLLPPTELKAKDDDFREISYYPPGMQWMDGSLRADIPMAELSALFNVKQFIVSQVNPHWAPFVAKSQNSDFPKLSGMENFLIQEIKNRFSKMAKLGVLPKFAGQDWSNFMLGMQTFEGNVTISPKASILDWWRMFNQPSLEDMSEFIHQGEELTFPHVSRMRFITRMEAVLREGRNALECNVKSLNKDDSKSRKGPCLPPIPPQQPTTNTGQMSWMTGSAYFGAASPLARGRTRGPNQVSSFTQPTEKGILPSPAKMDSPSASPSKMYMLWKEETGRMHYGVSPCNYNRVPGFSPSVANRFMRANPVASQS